MEERRDCGRRWKRVEEIVEGATKLWLSERLHNLSPPDGLSRVLMRTHPYQLLLLKSIGVRARVLRSAILRRDNKSQKYQVVFFHWYLSVSRKVKISEKVRVSRLVPPKISERQTGTPQKVQESVHLHFFLLHFHCIIVTIAKKRDSQTRLTPPRFSFAKRERGVASLL